MAQTDTIADMLTRIRNAQMAEHKFVDINFSKMNVSLAEALKNLGFVQNVLSSEEKRKIRIFLKYRARKSVIHGLKRISKPGRRIYVGSTDIPKVFSGLGAAIVSTPKGVMDGEKARELRVGGELLCAVW